MTKEKKEVAVTSISFPKEELTKYKNHSKAEGIPFSKMIKALFEEDMKDKENCIGNPVAIIERLRKKQERLIIINDNRSDNLHLEDLLKE